MKENTSISTERQSPRDWFDSVGIFHGDFYHSSINSALDSSSSLGGTVIFYC